MLTAIDEITADPMLKVPRPNSRGECEQEARPCPWVACRHHLAIEVAKAKPRAGRDARPPSLRLNKRSARGGRRPGLGSTADQVVRGWLRDALELLVTLPYTCSLDVVRDHPDGLTDMAISKLFATSEQAIQHERSRAEAKLREQMEAGGIDG